VHSRDWGCQHERHIALAVLGLRPFDANAIEEHGPTTPVFFRAAEMELTRRKAGDAERVTKYDDGDYHSIEWSYKNGALAYTFKWSDDNSNCSVSVFDSHE